MAARGWALLALLVLACAATVRCHYGGHHCGKYGMRYGGLYSGGGYYAGCPPSALPSHHPPHGVPPLFPPSGKGPTPSTPAPLVDSCGTDRVDLELRFDQLDEAAFQSGLPAFISGLAALVDAPSTDCITLKDGGRRRTLLDEGQVFRVFMILTDDVDATAAALMAAALNGRLAALVNLLGGRLAGVSFTLYDENGLPGLTQSLPASNTPSTGSDGAALAPAPAIVSADSIELAAAPAPALEVAAVVLVAELPPVPTPSAATVASAPVSAAAEQATLAEVSAASLAGSRGKRSSHLGAILGGAIGGGVGGLLVGAAIFYRVRRKGIQQGAPAVASMNPTFDRAAGATATVHTTAPAGRKGDLEALGSAASTPRSARHRHPMPFTAAAEGDQPAAIE